MSGRPREFDYEQALERAMEVFWHHGYEGTGMAELVERTGVAKQSLYNTFGNKQQLFTAALEHYAENQHRAVLDVLERPGSPLANIEALLAMWREKAVSEDCSGCFIVNSIVEVDSQDSEAARFLARKIHHLERGFREALERAAEAGEIPSSVDPRQMARILVNTAQGLAILGKLPVGTEFLDDIIEGTRALLSGNVG